MFKNYQYFLILVEEMNISKAASRLFITHQNLSKYLSNLETELGVILFNRKPVFSLTIAGRILYDSFRQTELLEQNVLSQYTDLREDKIGEIRIGTTEGRFRIIIPDIISQFKEKYPQIHLKVESTSSIEMRKQIKENKLDFAISNIPANKDPALKYHEVLEENIYLVISDHMLQQYLGKDWLKLKKELHKGADLRLFTEVPFALNQTYFNSHILIERHLSKLGVKLNCIHTSNHPDLHHMMSARDYVASFCLTMYLKPLQKLIRESENVLNVFPLKNFTARNHIGISYVKNRSFSAPAKDLIKIVKKKCESFTQYDL